MKIAFYVSVLFLSTIVLADQATTKSHISQEAEQFINRSTLINANNIYFWLRQDGQIGINPHTGEQDGAIFPRNTCMAVYIDGFLWAGYVKDGQNTELRAGGYNYYNGLQAGWIEEDGTAQNPADARLWRIRPDWETADLKTETAELLGISLESVTELDTQVVRNRYEYDWTHWPWEHGAPYDDANGNGKMDTHELRGVKGASLTIWYATNDLDSDKTESLYGSPPIGIENQVTLYALNPSQYELPSASMHNDFQRALRNTIFKKVKFVYKGLPEVIEVSRIDSLFFGIWVDSELGGYWDNFAGCDTSLQLGFGYNSTNLDEHYLEFGIAPPAFGYTLLAGPKQDNGHLAKMTAFWHKATGSTLSDPDFGSYEGTKQIYNLFNGLSPRGGRPFWKPPNGETRFMCSGDPVAGTGDLDGVYLPPGSRRYMMSIGPTNIKQNESKELVYAMVGASATDKLASVTLLKHYVKWIRYYFAPLSGKTGIANDRTAAHKTPVVLDAFPNPFNPETTLQLSIRKEEFVSLRAYDITGRLVRTILSGILASGEHSVQWDGRDDYGAILPSGVYLIHLRSASKFVTQKVSIIR